MSANTRRPVLVGSVFDGLAAWFHCSPRRITPAIGLQRAFRPQISFLDQNTLASKSATSSTFPQFRWQVVFLHHSPGRGVSLGAIRLVRHRARWRTLRPVWRRAAIAAFWPIGRATTRNRHFHPRNGLRGVSVSVSMRLAQISPKQRKPGKHWLRRGYPESSRSG